MESPAASPVFATTHWSVVMAVGGPQDTQSRRALATLCEGYWFPLYAHVRRLGHDPESARDLTQGFFEELLSHERLEHANPQRGRFRTFLLSALDNYLHHAHARAKTLKRGGEREFVSLDAVDAEQRLNLEPADRCSPDREFDRHWAVSTLERARHRLGAEFSLLGKAELFDALRPGLLGDSEVPPYAQLAARLNMTVVGVKVTMHRLRQRYGEIVREEVAHTLVNSADADAEIQYLIEALGS